MTGSLAIMAAIVALVILVEHWFPWQRLLHRDCPRLAAYTLGVLAIAGPLTAWLLWAGMRGAVLALWVAIVAAGAATVLGWVVDALLAQRDTIWVHEHGPTETE